ncbi:serine aminopeptidase domain-containing protein [Pseudomonas cichorii]|uniref:alpha/beta hydrolase family protein n=1 Tax=Pseudomonas cichorii TaxID=36746 RepID=UPI001C8953C7|nr:alpha/beta hydrolase [Pseudomonas cichorii]MBX8574830.1 alpha/beta fold hydrolase [Pseudomonas cichorii]
MRTTTHSITCTNGHSVEVTTHTGAGPVKAVVQINPATGVTERMYLPFAQYLVANGFTVITYNYRGVSRKGPHPKTVQAGFVSWADNDVEAVTHWVSGQYSGVPHLAVGHSFGGHAIGLCESSSKLSAAVTLCAHAGCLRFISPWQERLKVAILLKVLGPLSAKFLGYFPGRRLGIGEDLPADVMREWSRWTSLRQYFFDDPAVNAAARFARPTLPVLAIGVDDDPWAPAEAIDLMTEHLIGCAVERRQFAPADSHGSPIGHLGFFRQQHADTLWPVVTRWLEAQLPGNPNGA